MISRAIGAILVFMDVVLAETAETGRLPLRPSKRSSCSAAARGDHAQDSDYDLCVILADDIAPGEFTPVTLWRVVSDLGLPIQIVPLRSSAFEAARRDAHSISHQIDRDGRILYERAEAASLNP
jgi:uncharacterized protein